MTKPIGLFKGSALFLISAMINYAARFLISIIIARSLGLEGKGAYALIITTGSLFALVANPGLSSAITYFSANRKSDPQKLIGFLILSHLSSTFAGGLLLVGAYFLFLRDTFLIGISVQQLISILVYFPIYLLAVFLNANLLGNQRYFEVNLTDITRGVVNLVFQMIAWLLNLGLNGAIAAWLIANTTAMCLALYQTRSYFPPSFFGIGEIARSATLYGLKSYVANLLTFFNYRLDTFLVNMFAGFSQLGLYTTGVSIAEFLYFIPNSISTALFPKVPNLDPANASRLTARLCRYTFLLVLVGALLLAWVGEWLIVLFFSESFRAASGPLFLLLPGMLGVSIGKLLSAHLSGLGKPEYSARTAIVTVIVTVSGDILFIPIYGISGAAVVSSVAYLLSAILLAMWFLKETKLLWNEFILPQPSDAKVLIDFFQKALKLIHSSKNS